MNQGASRIAAVLFGAIAVFGIGVYILSVDDPSTPREPVDPKVETAKHESQTAELGKKPRNSHPLGDTPPSKPTSTNDVSTFVTPDRTDMGPDEGLAKSGDKPTWDDPVNERVLGDPKWMAQPTLEMQEQVRAASKKYIREPDLRIKPTERRLAIEAIRPVVDRCFEQAQANVPGLIGRAIVIFEASSAGTKGVIKNVRFGAVVKLDQDPTFRTCVISNAEGLGFDATEAGDERTVEYPFFYDR